MDDMLKKNYKTVCFSIIGFCFAFILLSSSFVYLFRDSYALDTKTFQFPQDTFTSNYLGSEKTNLVFNALKNNASYASYTHNFEMASNYKDSTNSTPLYSLMKNLRFPTVSEQFELVDGNPTGITDRGLLYIIGHGYNPTNATNTIFTTNQYGGVTDNTIKQYITQMAVWLYLFEHKATFADQYCIETSKGVNACDFYANGSTNLMSPQAARQMILEASKVSGYQYLNYITLLVDEANSYHEEPSSMVAIDQDTLNYVIASDGKSLVTEAITPSASENAKNYLGYSVFLHDPNQYGAYLVDSNNKRLSNTTNLTGSFKIYVPLQESLDQVDLSSIRVDITGTFLKLSGYSYRVTKSSESLIDKDKKQVFADILFGNVPTETTTVSLTLNNIVKISKVDAANSEELPGATLEVIDTSNDSVIATWVSTSTPKYLYLKKGSYKLCETIAPDTYKLSTECINFTVDLKHITSVTMKNYKKVKVPNTFLNSSKIIYMIGGTILVLGAGFVVLNIKKKSF